MQVQERHMGLFGATILGVGAIVGGGILALAGTAFSVAGPSAMVSFAMNGGIALLTAASFARLARRFPQSGGTYTYAKNVFSIELAFVVGWVVWFASIVAGVLYALGFAAFFMEGLLRALPQLAETRLGGDTARLAAAAVAIGAYMLALVRRAAGGGTAETIGKVVVFAVVIAGGAWAWATGSPGELADRLNPFFTEGAGGVVRAMGYTFIALQGFDLIAAVGGEVRDPQRTLPRAMYLSLGIALTLYLPMLFLFATVGTPAGAGGVAAVAAANPEGLVAAAVEEYMGVAGYWLVIGAGILSMLSALQANLLGASRVAFAMARDRTLPRRLARMRGSSGTPATAVVVTGTVVAVIALAVGEVPAAGAASSLIFLISFAMVHVATVLVEYRSASRRISFLPVLGGVCCASLAAFQIFAVPFAGSIVMTWIAIGTAFYLTLLAPAARLTDVSAEATHPHLTLLRGRSPLVLAPIANPASAASLVDIAGTLRTPGSGRVLLLTVLSPPDPASPSESRVIGAQTVLGQSMVHSLEHSMMAEILVTTAPDPWTEIARVADEHRCETVLLGLPNLSDPVVESALERRIAAIGCDVVVARTPSGWSMEDAERVLVPLEGHRSHSRPRVRLLASLARTKGRAITYLATTHPSASKEERRRFEREIHRMVRDEATGPYEIVVETAADAGDTIIRHGRASDLIVMGMRTESGGRRSLRGIPHAVAVGSDKPLILLGSAPPSTLLRTGRDLLAPSRRQRSRPKGTGEAEPKPPAS
ncbi:MAG: amino acid permease [Gammaproteobacteria bacterium]|nr:amino acid permease [Gammaproteobacteria bacterium]